jgi:hypothetical protein
MEISREDHLQWCKDRALEYVRAGEINLAIESMQSDLRKHPETNIDKYLQRAIDIEILFRPQLKDRVIKWIHGFN